MLCSWTSTVEEDEWVQVHCKGNLTIFFGGRGRYSNNISSHFVLQKPELNELRHDLYILKSFSLNFSIKVRRFSVSISLVILSILNLTILVPLWSIII